MAYLLLGLLLFLGVHSSRIVAEDWRRRRIESWGEGPWKGAYAGVSAIGLALIIWGYGIARQQPVLLWTPPRGMNHLAALLTLPAFVLLVAAYVPRNALRARLGHPMLLGVKLWALAHLLANGTLADVVLFGAFLVWAVLAFRAARGRDRLAAPQHAPPTGAGTAGAVLLGLALWVVFAFWGHAWLIGVRPFAG